MAILSQEERSKRRAEIIDLAFKGLTPNEIVARTGHPLSLILETCKRHKIDKAIKSAETRVVEEVTKEVFKDKVPQLKKLVGTTLDVLIQAMEELRDDPERRAEVLSSVSELNKLADMGTKMNELLRIENGQPIPESQTQTITFEQKRVALSKLDPEDPVFGVK